MSKKLGFALSAGGSRGCAHIGFLIAMEEAGIKPDFVAGCSMGAVIGACYCNGMSPKEMGQITLKLKRRQVVDLSLNPLGSGALLRSKKIRRKLKEFLGDKTFDQLQIPFKCVATDLIKGQTVQLGDDKNLLESVVASSAIPSIFKPIDMDGMLLADGGLLCRVPIKVVKDMGADVVVAIDALGRVRQGNRKNSTLGALLRMIDVVDAELTKYKTQENTANLFLEPELGDMVQYKFKGIQQAIEQGYRLGKANVQKIKELLAD